MDLATRKVLPHRAAQRREQRRLGRRQQDLLLHREGSGDAARAFACAAIASTAPNHTDVTADPVVWTQEDESFYTQLYRTKDEKYLLIHTQSTVSTEVWYADAAIRSCEFKVFLPRERDHEYQVEHANGRWIVRTNWQAKNFRIVEVPRGAEGDRTKWKDVVAHRDDAFVDAFDVSRNFLTDRGAFRRPAQAAHPAVEAATAQRRVRHRRRAQLHHGARRQPRVRQRQAALHLHVAWSTPRTTYDYDFRTGERELLKREPVLGGYDPANYATEFAWATARDGAKVPVSHRVPQDHAARRHRAAAADRLRLVRLIVRPGVLLPAAVAARSRLRRRHRAHPRRPGDGPRLVRERQAAQQEEHVHGFHRRDALARGQQVLRPEARVRASGAPPAACSWAPSPTWRPQDYRGIVAGVPFVDVVTTMLDETIPLTTNEFDEWGNPKEKEFYDYMLSYSPYDNLGAHDYPAMFVHSGLWDSQVQYYEPTKYVARLRARRTGDSLVVLRTNMEAGHGGKSGRYEHYREYAEQYAFIIDQAGIKELNGDSPHFLANGAAPRR